MSLPPLPPKYLPIPMESIRDAYHPDKRHGELFLTLCSLLALAWENKFHHTPRLREEDLYNATLPDGSEKKGYLGLSRRQYFQHKREMMLLGWLRSSSPATGYVQFTFTHTVASQAETTEIPDISAENRTPMQTNDASAKIRTNALKRIEEEDSNLIKDSESSSSSSQTQVRKTAPAPIEATTDSEKKIQLLIEKLSLLFDPAEYGLLEFREIFLAGIPERLLGWIAKAYQDRKRLESPIGLIVKNLVNQTAPDRYYMISYDTILPPSYLEAVGELDLPCPHCPETFTTQESLEAHKRTHHPCNECGKVFSDEAARLAHWTASHDTMHQAFVPDLEADDETVHAWTVVLDQLRDEMPKASFETWVRDSQAVRYDGNTLSVATRNVYARDWMTERLTETVQKMLIGIVGKAVTVEFVVLEQVQE
jgi:hypothetical protein